MFYILTVLISFLVSFFLLPFCIKFAKKFGILDHPTSSIKTHLFSTPYLGGFAIAVGFWISLICIRFLTHFPTGTLRSLRGIFMGSFIIFILGLIDDIKPLDYKIKFIVQLVCASVLFQYGIAIKIFDSQIINYFFSVLWILAIINGINIIDVMDGLSSTVIILSSFFFFLIGLPQENIYVNFASLALLGATFAFFIFNFPPAKIFMGDAGSLTSGFILASISLGAQYSQKHLIGLFSPVLILAVPFFDLVFVMFHRIRKGTSPFLGSKDHFALRLQHFGFTKKNILLRVSITCFVLGFCAWLITIFPAKWAFVILGCIGLLGIYFATWLSLIEVRE
ncbi:MAG: undecaprenyl/decaprenyl-phosphate alpha-N-acetylglucosaminyl 1-phosphate transferase [Elusimicrobia bacterium]|nr:undecaprenyl/decaprenyl-phosphate alpha-N-acetylglucosaminyl 1-phosphate transferase [Elusimicrobiota bacterium]